MKRVPHKILCISGTDRVGKTSIWLEINKQTKYKHFIIDRFTEGFLAYKEIFNKSDDLCNPEELKVFEEKMKNVPHLLIYLHCDADEIRQRCINTNEPLYDVELHQKIYNQKFEESTLDKIKIDTTGKTPEEVVRYLVKKELI